MSASLSPAVLSQALKNLSLQWQETKTTWHDAKSIEFEQKYLEALPNEAMRAINAIKELDALLRKVRSDCE